VVLQNTCQTIALILVHSFVGCRFTMTANVLAPCAVAALGSVNMKQDKNFLGKNKTAN
jgi:hypothetical protein